MSLSSKARRFYRGVMLNFYGKPKALIELLGHKDCYKAEGYYPELGTTPHWKVFCYQVWQILKYGFRNDYYYMYGLDVKSKAERKEYLHYIPFQLRRDELNYLENPHNSTCILRNKLYFDMVARSLGIETPRIYAYTSHGELYIYKDSYQLSAIDDLKTIGVPRLFCKETEGECGAGIFILEIKDNKFFISNDEVSVDDLKKRLLHNDYLLQGVVEQHEKMSALYSGSINTMRFVTVRSLKDGEIHVLPSMLRIGANGNFVDNTSQGGIAVGFDTTTGQLHKWGFFKPQFGRKVSAHPNSGTIFNEFYIPYIDLVREAAIRFHSVLKDIHSIGWDIAVGPNGPVFIEGNDNWEINGPQVGNHGLRKEFLKYFYK